MNALIIEDEILAADRLRLILQQYDPAIRLQGVTTSVEESVQWLQRNPVPDFILLDIQLSDGSAFDIFKQVKVSAPVIFTTAYDQYALEAFKLLSIDYLLKPVTLGALSAAIEKLKTLRQQNTLPMIDYQELLTLFRQHRGTYKTRFMAKSGARSVFLETGDICYFEADNKIIQVAAMDGGRYLVDFTLEQLESVLDPRSFFRINRSVIVQFTGIIQVRPYLNSRLEVSLRCGPKSKEMVISRERISDFNSWANS